MSKMSKYTTYIGRFIIIDIERPIFSTDTYSRVMINKDFVDEAKKSSRVIVVRTPKGETIKFPEAFKKMKITEKVFLRPDEPMKMYTLDILHCEKKPREFFEVS